MTPADLPAVCVVGNLNTDLIIRGVADLPRWGEEAVGSTSINVPAGQAGYLALGLRQLDVPTHVVGNVGDDASGRWISGTLAAAGADIGGVEITPGGTTGVTVAVVRTDGERAFVSDLGCLSAFDEALLLRHWDHVDAAAVMCLVGLFNLGSLGMDAAVNLLARARKQGCTTVLDSGWDPEGWPPETVEGLLRLLGEVDVFLPNLDEAAAITGSTDATIAAEILQSAGPSTVVVKCGAAGSHGRHAHQTHDVAAMAVPVVDAVGAGDAFNAAFLRARLAGRDLAGCMDFANTAAGLYVSRPEDRFPTAEQIAAVPTATEGASTS